MKSPSRSKLMWPRAAWRFVRWLATFKLDEAILVAFVALILIHDPMIEQAVLRQVEADEDERQAIKRLRRAAVKGNKPQ